MAKYVVRVIHSEPGDVYIAADQEAEAGITSEVDAAYVWDKKQDADFMATFMNKGRHEDDIAQGFGCEVVEIVDDPLPLP